MPKYNTKESLKPINKFKESQLEIILASFDGGSRFPGARSGPGIFFQWLEQHHPDFKSDLKVHSLPFISQGTEICLDLIEEYVKEYLKGKYNKLILMGGDHSVSAPSIKAFSELYKEFKVIIFDAHHDFDDLIVLKNWNISKYIATFSTEILIVGVRDLETHLHLPENVEIITMEEIDNRGLDFLNNRLELFLDGQNVYYLSLDLDVIDPSEFPGVSYLSPGGFTVRELNTILTNLLNIATPKMVDIVEFNPLVEKEVSCSVITSLLKLLKRRW